MDAEQTILNLSIEIEALKTSQMNMLIAINNLTKELHILRGKIIR